MPWDEKLGDLSEQCTQKATDDEAEKRHYWQVINSDRRVPCSHRFEDAIVVSKSEKSTDQTTENRA